MLRKTVPLLAIVMLVSLFACDSKKQASELTGDTIAETVKWKTAMIAYTFRNFSFFEAVKKTRELGLHYIGGYPGQAIGSGIEGNMDYTMDAEKREKILNFLKEQDVKLIDFGVITPKTHSEWKQLFEFAKAMDIPTIVSEPQRDELAMVAQLCDEYSINLAIHNHPAPSLYADPDTLVAAIAGLSTRIGACADVGHWIRSGLEPIASLKKLEGRLLELHFKDESENGKDAVEVVWGTGTANVKGMLEELHRQGFAGFLSIEYESKPEDNMNEIAQSIEYYKQVLSGF
jgi:sugar phosphate isomerase/epimerase